jgi:Gpi18-like mannosyltransferase
LNTLPSRVMECYSIANSLTHENGSALVSCRKALSTFQQAIIAIFKPFLKRRWSRGYVRNLLGINLDELALLLKQIKPNIHGGLRRHPLVVPFLIGLALRLAFVPFLVDPYDASTFFTVTNDLLAGLNMYATNSFSYPPLWAYAMHPTVGLTTLFVSPNLLGVRIATQSLSLENWQLPAIVTSPLFNILFKLPLIIADVLIGLILYRIIKELRDEKKAKMAFVLWFLNPLVILIDSVLGQFDVLPTLMIVLAFCLLCNRNYFASGSAIGAGVLFKIFPIYFAPLYLFSIAKLESKGPLKILENLRNILPKCSRFLAGILVPFFIFLSPLINSNIIHDIFARTQTVSGIGGLTIFSVAEFPGMQWLLLIISLHSGMVFWSLMISSLVAILLVSFAFFTSQKDFLEIFLLGNVAIILIIFVTSLVVNPQYIVWILPFMIVEWGLYKRNLIKLSLLSIVASVFLIGIGGPLFFFRPLAVFTPLLSVNTVYSSIQFFENYDGWAILFTSGILGVIVIILCLKDTLKLLLKKRSKFETMTDRGEGKTEDNDDSSLKIRWGLVSPLKILTLVLVALMLGQSLAFVLPRTQQNASFQVQNIDFANGKWAKLNYVVKSAGWYPVDIQVSATPSTSILHGTIDKAVFMYYDPNYPSSLVGDISWMGLIDHVPVELKLRGYDGPVKIVDAEELKNAIRANPDSIVLIPSGVLPETVHANNESLLGNWLLSGGTLIWVGDVFAYFSGYEGKVIQPFSESNFSQVQNQILGFTLFDNVSKEDERLATIPSDYSNALDLQYPDAITGAYVSEVLNHGGEILGKITSSQYPRTSIAYVPAGNGHLLLFGGGVGRTFTPTGEDAIAHDIAQIICSDFEFSSQTVTSSLHHLGRNEVESGSINVPLPQNQNITGIMIVAFSESPYDRYFSRQFLTIGDNYSLLS